MGAYNCCVSPSPSATPIDRLTKLPTSKEVTVGSKRDPWKQSEILVLLQSPILAGSFMQTSVIARLSLIRILDFSTCTMSPFIQRHNPQASANLHSRTCFRTLTVDQPEDIIEHKVAPVSIRQQLKYLRVIHRPLFLVNLYKVSQPIPRSLWALLPA